MGLSIDRMTIHLPETILSNEMLAKEFNITEQEIFKKTGIKKRFVSNKDQTASDLAFHAAEKLVNSITKDKIDFLIFCSDCFDYIAPASSCILQSRLNLSESIGCMDLPYGCSGYVYGLGIANGLLQSNMASNILFLTCDTSTKTLAKNNLEQRSLFSDVATASLITKKDNAPINQFVFGTDGKGAEDLYIANSGFRRTSFSSNVDLPFGEMVMDGTNVFTFALKRVPTLIEDILIKNQITFDEIDLFIFHQANGFLLETLRKKINIPKSKFYTNMADYGNTVASSIPLAIYTAENERVLNRGMKVLVAGFGVGNSWAATIINY